MNHSRHYKTVGFPWEYGPTWHWHGTVAMVGTWGCYSIATSCLENCHGAFMDCHETAMNMPWWAGVILQWGAMAVYGDLVVWHLVGYHGVSKQRVAFLWHVMARHGSPMAVFIKAFRKAPTLSGKAALKLTWRPPCHGSPMVVSVAITIALFMEAAMQGGSWFHGHSEHHIYFTTVPYCTLEMSWNPITAHKGT